MHCSWNPLPGGGGGGVGTGSGILAIFAAQAGARKVYAVEATDMAKVAKRLVDTNNVRQVVLGSHIIEMCMHHSPPDADAQCGMSVVVQLLR